MMLKGGVWGLILVILLHLILKSGGYQDIYMREAKHSCSRNSDISLSCLKYEILLFFHRIFSTKRRNIQISSVELVDLPSRLRSGTNFSFLTRSMKANESTQSSEWSRFLDFLDREAIAFLESHAFQLPIPELAPHVPLFYVKVDRSPENLSSSSETSRSTGHSTGYKKYYLLFPLIAVFKFLIIKLLLIPILIGVFAIKKMLVAAAMALPTFLQLFRCRNPGAPGNLVLPAAVSAGYAAHVDPIVTDFSHYGYPQKVHPSAALYGHHHHLPWENLKNYKSAEQLE